MTPDVGRGRARRLRRLGLLLVGACLACGGGDDAGTTAWIVATGPDEAVLLTATGPHEMALLGVGARCDPRHGP